MGNIFSYSFIQEYIIDGYKSIEKGLETSYQDMFSFPFYDDIDDEMWYNDVIPLKFVCFNDDDIL